MYICMHPLSPINREGLVLCFPSTGRGGEGEIGRIGREIERDTERDRETEKEREQFP